MKPTLEELEKLLVEGWEKPAEEEVKIVAEPYTITEHDAHCNGAIYKCPPAAALYFSPGDIFAIFDESLERDGEVVKDELKHVTVETQTYKLHLIAERYSRLREFQDMARIYKLDTECLIPPLGRIYLPRYDSFMLRCIRYRRVYGACIKPSEARERA